MSMTVIHYIGKGQAMIEVECVAKEFSKSIRFMLSDGTTMTIKRKDIISIENHDVELDSIYQINCDGTGKDCLTITNVQTGKFFGGYDFMGSVDWLDSDDDAYRMDLEEAKQIISDLEAADEPIVETEEVKALQTKLDNGTTLLTLYEDDCYSFFLKDQHHAFTYMFGLPMEQQSINEAISIAIANVDDYTDLFDD